jgi:hypothetical protein
MITLIGHWLLYVGATFLLLFVIFAIIVYGEALIRRCRRRR